MKKRNKKTPKHENISIDSNTEMIQRAFNEGIKYALAWRSIDEFPLPINDCLILLEGGAIRRYNEEWEYEREIVTHWRPIFNEDI